MQAACQPEIIKYFALSECINASHVLIMYEAIMYKWRITADPKLDFFYSLDRVIIFTSRRIGPQATPREIMLGVLSRPLDIPDAAR